MKYEQHDLDLAIHDYADHIVANYRRWSDLRSLKDNDPSKFQVTFARGRKFIKVIDISWGSRSVHSFICVQPHDQWKFGDILKAASWAAPAKNFARGNVLDPDSYKNTVSWTGA